MSRAERAAPAGAGTCRGRDRPALPPPPRGSPAARGGRPWASCHPSARAAGGCPPRDKTTGAHKVGRWRHRRWRAAGPPAGSAWPGPTLTQRVVLLEHPLHGVGRREAEPAAARPGCGRAGARAERPGLSLSRSLSQQQQPRLGRRDFRLASSLATTRNAALPAGGPRGGAVASGHAVTWRM